MRRPRHSTVVAYLALFVALTGTSYAAVTLKANSVGSREIRNGSIHPEDLARKARPMSKRTFRAAVTEVVLDPNTQAVVDSLSGAVKGEKGDKGDPGAPVVGPEGPQGSVGGAGPQGVEGSQGTAGGSWGYARVGPDGTLSANSGIEPVGHPAAGIYCIDAVLPAHVAIATPEGDGASTRAAVAQVSPDATTLCNGHDVQVSTAVSGTAADAPFYVMIN